MFWLSGHTHSGTTLLQSLLDGHPECLVYPVEPYFYASFSRDSTASPVAVNRNFLFRLRNRLHPTRESIAFRAELEEQGTFDVERISAFLQDVAKDKKIAKIKSDRFDHATFFRIYYAELLAEMQTNAGGDRKFNVEAAFKALQAAVAATVPELAFGPHMVFKQPVGQLRHGALDWFFESWPEGKMVFMIRNPYARIWSHMRHEADMGRSTVRWSTDRAGFLKMVRSYAQDHVLSRTLPRTDKILKVKYEDLATRPEDIMKRVCGFLGIDFHACCLEPSVFGHASSPSTNRTGKNTINASSLHKWKDNLTAVEKAVIAYHIARASARGIYRPNSVRWSI